MKAAVIEVGMMLDVIVLERLYESIARRARDSRDARRGGRRGARLGGEGEESVELGRAYRHGTNWRADVLRSVFGETRAV